MGVGVGVGVGGGVWGDKPGSRSFLDMAGLESVSLFIYSAKTPGRPD